MRSFNPVNALGDLFSKPAPEEATSRPREAHFIDGDDDLFRTTGAGLRDLTGNTLRRAQDLSVELYRKNPLANRIIKIYTTYMAGEGFALEAHNPDVQAAIDEFWDAERNDMAMNHRRFARDYLLNGEAPHPVATDDTGNTTIGYIDPQRIDHVNASSLNRLILESIVIRKQGGEQILDIVRREQDIMDEDAGLLTGDIFFWLHDRIGAATRGTPFLLAAIDWLDAYDQTLWEMLERIKATRAFFWDVEVAGGADEIAAAKKDWGTTAPRSGSVRFRTEAIKISAEQPNIGTNDDVSAATYLLRHIATAAGLAPTWLGDPEDANRSTAEQMDKPVLRALEDTQGTWKAHMEELLRFVVDRKVAAGMLERIVERHDEQGNPTGDMVPASSLVEVVVPALTDDAIVDAATSLAQMATAFVQLDMIDVVDRDTLRKVVRHVLPALGIPADQLPDPDDEETTDEEVLAALEALRRP